MDIKNNLNKKVNSYFAFRKDKTNAWILEIIYWDNWLYCKCILFNQLEYNNWFATHYIDYTNKTWDELDKLLYKIWEDYSEIHKKQYYKIYNKFVDNFTNIWLDIKKIVINKNICK